MACEICAAAPLLIRSVAVGLACAYIWGIGMSDKLLMDEYSRLEGREVIC